MKSHRPPSEGAPPETVLADDGVHGPRKHHGGTDTSRDDIAETGSGPWPRITDLSRSSRYSTILRQVTDDEELPCSSNPFSRARNAAFSPPNRCRPMPVSSSMFAMAADRSSSHWPAIAACSVRSDPCPARRSSKAGKARVARDEKMRRIQSRTQNSYLFILTRFLHANRYPLRWKTR
jgi:hypothetical protein